MSTADAYGDSVNVRQYAMDSAAAVFERLVQRIEDRVPPAGRGETVDVYADLLAWMADASAGLLDRAAPARRSVRDAQEHGAVVVLSGPPGLPVEAPVWMHNATEAKICGVVLRMTDLIAHDGSAVGAAAGAFHPAALDVEPGASGSVLLSVTLRPETEPGVYHGLVLATGLPQASLPVRMVVES